MGAGRELMRCLCLPAAERNVTLERRNPLSLKVTEPVGPAPVTIAFTVTCWFGPANDGVIR